MPLHWPGHNFCGPFTSDLRARPVSEIDECCRTHDLQYGDVKVSTKTADAQLVDCLRQSDSTSGTIISALIQGKELIDTITNYASDNMLRNHAKRKREVPKHDGPNKMPKINIKKDDDLDLVISDKGLYHKDGTAYTGRVVDGDRVIFDGAAMDTNGGEAQVGPVDTAVGAISMGNLQPTHADTAGIRTFNFSRSFQHYVCNDTQTFGTWDYEPFPKDGQDQDYARITLKHNCMEIPYAYLNGAMTRAEMETHLTPATSWRCVSVGYKVTNILPLLDQQAQVAGGVHKTIMFDNRPQLLAYVDTKQGYFQQTEWDSGTLPNTNLTHNVPRTREEGQLKQITGTRIVHKEWFKHQFNKDYDTPHLDMNLDDLTSLWNTQEMKFLNPGETWQFTWVNPTSFWYNNMSFTMHGDTMVEAPILSIQRLLPVEIRGVMNHGFTPDNSTRMYSKRPSPNYDPAKAYGSQRTPCPGKSVLSQMPMNPSAPPPVACLMIPPLLTSENKPASITYQITVMYEVTLQTETLSGSPQYAGFTPTQTDFYRDHYKSISSHRRTQLGQWPAGLRNYSSNITTKDGFAKHNNVYTR